MQGMMLLATQQQWTGPYPPPEAAERFEALLPGAFGRILAMAERAQEAQLTATDKAQTYLRNDTLRGHWLGFASSLAAMAGAGFCVYEASPWVAAAFLGVPVMAVARAFIGSTQRSQVPTIPVPALAAPNTRDDAATQTRPSNPQ